MAAAMEEAKAVLEVQLQEEYALEAERLRELLQQCGIVEDDLSKNGQMYLHVLSEMAELLRLKDVKTSSFLMASSDLEQQVESEQQKAVALQAELSLSQNRSQELQAEWNDLEHVAEQLRAAMEERERHENTLTMEQRTRELEDRQRAYETELDELQKALREVHFDEAQDSYLPPSSSSSSSPSSVRPSVRPLVAFMEEANFKEREAELLRELSALYTKLNQVREKRAKAEQEYYSSDADGSDANDAKTGSRRRRRILLVTRSLPFTLISEEEQSQWRAEFPENISLDGALETYLCVHENFDCVWIGSVHGEIEPSEQNTLREQLLQDRNYYPVFLDPKREKLFYNGFCKTILWPLFHSCPPTTEDQLITHDFIDGTSCGYVSSNGYSGEEDRNMEKMWQAYVAANQAFADAVQEVYEEGDLVWIQGYHLTLVPQMVQSLFPNENIHIGYFMHIPFPSSELYRILNYREEILTGILGADLIGFQTYEYARHFQSSAVRLLGLESSHKGVDFNGHFARVTICPVGIDAKKYHSLAQTDGVKEQIATLRAQFAGKKVLLGVDQLDLTKGLVHKLLAVEELFTLKPELSKEVVFVQIVTGAPYLFESPLGSQVESLVSRINSKLQDIGAEGPVQYLNKEISVDALIALYCLADTLVVTPVRDGMNTMPFEYVVCREAFGKHGRVVLSEFAGCAQSLGGAMLVNPWNTEELLDALLHSLQDSDEVMRSHQHMYSYVSTFTSRHWADNFLEQLRECSEESCVAVSGRELSRRDMTSAYARSTRRLIFINYEGVLAAEASIPELSYPPQELIWQLSMLTKDTRNTVVLVSARSTAVCEQWFAGLSGNIVLAAEYGVYVKWIGEKEYWHCMVPNLDLSWWEHVLPLLEYYTERTPGAFIERKDSSVAWHYRDCDLDHGLWQASELLVSLREITRSLPVSVVPGNRYLEVRPQKVSKASLFERIWEFMNWSTLFTDEDPVTTEYFGDPVKPSPSPLLKPWPMCSARWRHGSGEIDPFKLEGTHKDQSVTGEHIEDTEDQVSWSVDAQEQPVDFLLVIASGDDRTDEDLFDVLVPPPIDLEAYCKQLEREVKVGKTDGPLTFSVHEEDVTLAARRRRSLNDSGYDSATYDESGNAVTSPKRSFRQQLSRRESGSSHSPVLESAGMGGLHQDIIPSQLARLPSQGPDSDFLVLGENITKLTPMFGSGLLKLAISEDAANMFPRNLLTTPANARREEITEKGKFTPRREFPPSAALFKAMKTKYGDSFGMHKLPDTPAACWALVCPPNARAKLEDSDTQQTNSISHAQSFDPKVPASSSVTASGAMASPTSSTATTGDETRVSAGGRSSSTSPTRSGLATEDQEEVQAKKRRPHYLDRAEDDGDESDEDDRYRYPVNTFVCTLGRKLSQAPYYIKNSADLFQLLQEMGLSSHIRTQRLMSMGSAPGEGDWNE
ncbi:TPA: hypothetical protein N0F65_011449 [Lagenidium giganteum]|uniref:Trehalose-phosphatase n=1 Tax=Lagenidium giganteum TaxID=4803 RepID=A0AAV2Z9D3_9STRA|nr:TPA: hypothetical protein N0F65_011449 [Lagenidium giganteum]